MIKEQNQQRFDSNRLFWARQKAIELRVSKSKTANWQLWHVKSSPKTCKTGSFYNRIITVFRNLTSFENLLVESQPMLEREIPSFSKVFYFVKAQV